MYAVVAAAASSESSTSAWNHVVTGAGFVGLGTWVAFDKTGAAGNGDLRALAATFYLATGGSQLAFGLHSLRPGVTTDQGRFARFRRDRASGRLSEVAIARYEGELDVEAKLARADRIAEGVAGIGLAASSALLIGFAAGSELRGDARTLAYTEGVGLLAVGLGISVWKLGGESSNEREWRVYHRSALEREPDLALMVSPDLRTRSASLTLTGTLQY